MMKPFHSVLFITAKQPIYLHILQAMLRSRGCEITVTNWDTAAEKGLLAPEKFELVIIFEAVSAPVRAPELTQSYLQRGGKLIILGAPVFSKVIYSFTPLGGAKRSGRSKEQLLQALDHSLFGTKTLLDFSDPSILPQFKKDTANPDSKKYEGNAILSIDDCPFARKKCLKWYTPDFYINENFEIPLTIPLHYDALTFCARADKMTRTITLTLVQKDGMTFKTTFMPQTEWQRYVFLSKDFRFAGMLPGYGRPQQIPTVNFSNVTAIRIGHAVSHAYSCAGEHTFYIDEIAAAHIPFADQPRTVIPGVYPEYKFYPVTSAKRVVAAKGQNIISTNEKFLLPETEVASISPLSQSSGLDKHRRFRFIPLIEMLDAHRLHCGYAAYMLQFYSDSCVTENVSDRPKNPFMEDFKRLNGGMVSVFTPTDNQFYCHSGCKAICDTAVYMLRKIRLLEGGSREYAYFADRPEAKAGAVIAIEKDVSEEDLSSAVLTISGCGIHRTMRVDELPVIGEDRKGKYQLRKAELDFTAQNGRICCLLAQKDALYDRIECEVQLYEEKPEKERRFAKIAKDGECEIEIGGNITRFFGVNYMPSGCIGNEDGAYHEFYFSRFSYDPEIIRTDLKRIAAIGMNAVSVFIYSYDCVDNLNFLHFISLCREYGLFIDLGLRPHATPFQFDEEETAQMINRLRLNECDRIVAYDISWERYNGTYEPCYGNYFGRKSYDAAFCEYLLNRFGSFENAEAFVGIKLPRNSDGEVIGASDEMLRTDGEHRRFVAVYRHFVDAHVRRAHYRAAQKIKQYDPNHLLTARTGDASTIPLVDPGIYGYDYRCLAPGLDFYSPESYALSEKPEILRQAVFTGEYSRFYNPNAVVQWKEFGKSIWCGSNFTDNSIGKEIQANFYRKFFDTLLLAHTSGIYAWWWAGGYRIGENSDFGVINPDGSDRAVTRVLREYAPKFLHAPLLPKAVGAVAFDRSENATGLEHGYQKAEKDFFAGWDKGQRTTLCNAGTGKTTRTIEKTLPPDADGAADSFFLDWITEEETVEIPVFNPSQCAWDDNVSLLLMDENRKAFCTVPLQRIVHLTESAVFTAPKEDFARACYLTLAADGVPFGEIIRKA